MKLPNEQDALKAIAKHHERKERVVFTNGCFDILHVGHVCYLEQAKALGDVLVVGLNSDSSVVKLKGPQRPIVPQAERGELLLALKPVDYVIVFSEDTPLELIKKVKPDVLVKGGDWPVEKIVGADFVQANGGKAYSLPFVDGSSTTNIIEKIRGSI
jgi:rfaE bifunctional protein nucleotidyltransferase chain/domain